MKKYLSLFIFFAIQYCYAGTGGARDFGEFVIAILVVLGVIIGIAYLIKFFVHKIKYSKEKKYLEPEQTEANTYEITDNNI